MKKLKICFYCDTIFSFGGVQRVLAVIAGELSKEHDEIVHVKKMGQYELVIFDTDEEKVEFLNQKKMILDARDPK